MQGSSSFPCYSCYSHSDKNFLAIPSRLIHRNHQNEDSLYKSWFELERFGLVVFKKLSGTYQFNNALASFTMVVFFGISAVIWSYLLCGSTTKAKLQPAFFMIPYVASPIFAEMLGFLLLGPEISVASFLVALSLMLWSNANRPKNYQRC